MANEITGREILCGLSRGSNWHTAEVCGAGDGMLILSDNIKAGMDLELDESAGQPWVTEADTGVENVSGSIESYLRYDGFDLLLSLVMGLAGVPTQIAATAAYNNTLNLSSKIDGLFGTLAQKKLDNTIWENPSVKIHGFKISGEMNKPLKITFDVICDTLVRDSTINTVATMAAVTAVKKNRIIMNSNTVFRMNDKTAEELSSSHNIYPSGFELTFNRPMSTDFEAGQVGVAEPADDGFPTLGLTLKFPRYNSANDGFFDDWKGAVSKKLDITFTGKEIESGNNYMFKLLMPNLKVDNPEAPVSGPGKIPFSMNLKGLGCELVPAGMTGLSQPMRIMVTNTRTTDPLA